MNEEIKSEEEVKLPDLTNKFKYLPFFNNKQPVFVLIILGIIFYCTSLENEYALDDGIIIHQNDYVLKGVEGIPEILSNDSYSGFYKRMNASDQLAGGRYRPLSVISFALEQEFIGPYRSGYYMHSEDLNKNGVLDDEKVNYQKYDGSTESNYEYNNFIDLNKDGKAQTNECFSCWDLNGNFKNDVSEDLNKDGVFNEVDCQVYGAGIRHFNNMWTYVLCVVLLYLVFRNYMFKDNQDLAFIAALIFLAHPVHSEVVANIKGRDDIFSMIFIALTFLFSFKFMENKKLTSLLIASVAFFLALLSMEYAAMLLFLIPLAMYVFNKVNVDSLKFTVLSIAFVVIALALIGLDTAKLPFQIPGIVPIVAGPLIFAGIVALGFNRSFLNKDLISLMSGLFCFALLYLGLRVNATNMAPGVEDTEVLNNPYVWATGEEEFASKIYVMLKYLSLSIFPHPLVSDYSYNSIAYRHYTDWDFILSLVLNLTLLYFGIRLVLKRHVLGFAIITYFAFLIMVENFFFFTGTVMLESYLFHASIGIAIAFAWLILAGLEKFNKASLSFKRNLLIGSLLGITILYGCKTWERNLDWKNDVTLFLKDIKNNPNSVMALGNAGARWIDLADTKEITGINLPGTDSTVFNDYNGTLKITDEEVKSGGFKDKRETALNYGIKYLKKAVELHPRYVNGYLNLGLAYFKLKDDKKTLLYWKMAESLYPNNPYLNNYYTVYMNSLKSRGADAFNKGNMNLALIEYNKCTILNPDNAEVWYFLGGCYFNLQNYAKAKKCWEKALRLNPDYKEVKNALAMPVMVDAG